MLRCHSINAVHVIPFMCVTYRQIRFCLDIGSPLLFCTTQTTSRIHKHTHTHTPNHSISAVECHTRIKACIELKEILSYYCPRSFETALTCPMNVRFWGWLKPTKLCSLFRNDVYAKSIHFVWGTIFHILNWLSLNSIWNWQDP